MKVDSGLCQPAGTPILVQTSRRLGVTFFVDVETDVFRPVHVSVERRITLLTDVQAAFNTLTVVFRSRSERGEPNRELYQCTISNADIRARE